MIKSTRTLSLALCLAASGLCHAQLPAIDAAGTAHIDSLLSQMTLQEKLGQLNLQVAGDISTGAALNTNVGRAIARGEIGGVFNIKGADRIRALQDIAVRDTRLGIPLIVGMDVIHGYETIFPIPLAIACSWDVEAAEEVARISAREATADGIAWTFSPMVDIALDARWGRIAEGSGEDPYLGSLMAAAMVRGYQGADMSAPDRLLSCIKHFALYGAAEAGREYNTVDMSRLRMHNQYLPPYRAAVDAGAGSLMTSFNIVDGTPATANRWLVSELLRRQWGFRGMVVTDYASISEIATHGTAASLRDAALQALAATTDMDMCSSAFVRLSESELTQEQVRMVDDACRRVLEAKWRLGLFADPYARLDASRRATDIGTPAHRAAARRIATETFVLLKNDTVGIASHGNRHPRQQPLLPLSPDLNIALIGPLGDNRPNMDGTWVVAATPEHNTTLYEAMQQAVAGRGTVRYAQGCNLTADSLLQVASEFGKSIPRHDPAQLHDAALAVARDADVIVCAMGECADMSGESSSRTDLLLPDVQRALLAELTATDKPVVLLHFAGRPTVLTWEQAHVDAILNVWFGGTMTAEAICDVVFGNVSPQGRLAVSMPLATGQEPLYYNHLPTGRPVARGTQHFRKYQSNYLDVRNDPLYPFGFGLTYTTFAYSTPRLSASHMHAGQSVRLSIEVANTGTRRATEVVQLYVHDRVASVSRPVQELKAFRRICLDAGEHTVVDMDITTDMLTYLDADGNTVLEPGVFDIMVGPSSADTQSVELTLRAD